MNKNYKNYILDYVKHESLCGNKTNCFKYYKNNTKEHEMVKFQVYMKLIDLGYDVLIEPELKRNLGRPDILAISKNRAIIIEIMNTETINDMKDKFDKYPIDFEIEPINCKGFKIEEWEI